MNVKDIIKNANAIEKQISRLSVELNECKNKIQQFFDKKGIKNIVVENEDQNGLTLVANKTERVYIDYDMDKLKEKLDKNVFDKIVVKQYIVVDMEGLVTLLREVGVKPREFKEFIKTIITPNKESLKNLYEIGEITKADLEGCYSAKIVKSIQIKEKG